MITFENIVHVNRPIEDVYAYLADLANLPDWNWAITSTVKITPGPVAVGTRYRQTRNVPRPATETLEITELEPGRHIEIDGTLAQFPAHVSYDLEQTDVGTEVTNVVNLRTHGPLRLAAPILGPRIEEAVASNLDQLKTRLERTPA